MKMLKVLPYLATVCFSALITASNAQVAATVDTSPLPFHSYSGGKFDHIQMQNGGLFFKIPLFELPQLGGTKMSFSIVGQSSSRVPQSVCDSYGGCVHYFITPDGAAGSSINAGELYPAFGARVVHDQAVALVETPQLEQGSTSANLRRHYSVREGDGTTHQMGYDAADFSMLHSTDGSGWALKLPISNTVESVFSWYSYNSNATAYDPAGNRYEIGYNVSNMRDPFSNTISAVAVPPANGQVLSNQFTGFTDSVSRNIAFPGQGSTNPSGCPNLGISDQVASSSSLWSVPGPNGGTSTYRLCYTTITLATNYWGYGGTVYNPISYQDPETGQYYQTVERWDEESGQVTVLQSIVLPDNSRWAFIYDSPQTGAQYTYGDIVEIRTPEGGTLHYNYGGVAACGEPEPGPSALYSPTVRGVMQRTASSGSGPNVVTTYQYAAQQTTETTVGNDTVHSFTLHNQGGCGADETTTTFWQGAANSGSLLKRIDTVFSSTYSPQSMLSMPSAGLYVPPPNVDVLPTQVTTQITGQATSTVNQEYEQQFTDVDVVATPTSLSSTSYGILPWQVGIKLQPPASTVDSVKTVLTPSYFSTHSDYRSANLLNLRASVETLDGSNNRASYREFHYDEGNGSPQGALGDLTSTSDWLGSTSITSSTVFNNQGMVTQTTDPNGGSTKINSFQCNGLFPSSITKAFGTGVAQTTSSVQDCNTGALLQATNPNNVLTVYERNDPLGRVTKARFAANTVSESNTVVSYPSRTQIVMSRDKESKGDGALVTTTSYDGLGRIAQQRQPGGVIVDTTYDSEGNVASVTNPHWSSSSPTDGLTSYLYDAIGRKTTECMPDNGSGSTCNPQASYRAWTYTNDYVTTRDEDGKKSKLVYDALGRLTAAYEDPYGTNLHTDYTYDTLDNLASVTQWGVSGESARTRSFKFDPLSRLRWSHNPEAGVICYGHGDGTEAGCQGDGYDGNGNLLYKTDARIVVVNYSYDALNRLVSKTYNNDAVGTLSTCYQYDTSTIGYPNANLVGRLTHEWTQPGGCDSINLLTVAKTRRSIRAYDATGHIRTEERCVLANCSTSTAPFALHFDYDLAGNLTGYDDGTGTLILSNYYNAAGRLFKVGSNIYDATRPNALYTVESFIPSGAPSVMDFGSHLQGTQSTDSRLRPTQFTVTGK